MFYYLFSEGEDKYMSDDFKDIFKSINKAGESIGKFIQDAQIKSDEFNVLANIGNIPFPEIEFPEDPLIGLAQEQLAETKKMNETVGSLEKRISELENKNELASKNQWKHDLLMTVIGAVLAFIFGLIILLFD